MGKQKTRSDPERRDVGSGGYRGRHDGFTERSGGVPAGRLFPKRPESRRAGRPQPVGGVSGARPAGCGEWLMPERPAEAEVPHPAPVGSGQGRAAQRDRAAFSRDSSPIQGGGASSGTRQRRAAFSRPGAHEPHGPGGGRAHPWRAGYPERARDRESRGASSEYEVLGNARVGFQAEPRGAPEIGRVLLIAHAVGKAGRFPPQTRRTYREISPRTRLKAVGETKSRARWPGSVDDSACDGSAKTNA